MDNVSDALKMAGAVLIFVMALSITIVSFGQVRETADIILDYKDRETTYINANLYYKVDVTDGLTRQVGLETVIPSIYRAYLENYRIVFKGLDRPVYSLKKANGDKIEKYSIDLEANESNVSIADNASKAEFLRGILYRDFDGGTKADFEKKFGVIIEGDTFIDSLYYKLNGKKITEFLGVYYQNDDPNVPDSNKVEKRIITYKI